MDHRPTPVPGVPLNFSWKPPGLTLTDTPGRHMLVFRGLGLTAARFSTAQSLWPMPEATPLLEAAQATGGFANCP